MLLLSYFTPWRFFLHILVPLTRSSFEADMTIFVSELPEDEWFNEICQDAMERLSGKPKEINGERELNSPTASVSAQSISSVRSHSSS